MTKIATPDVETALMFLILTTGLYCFMNAVKSRWETFKKQKTEPPKIATPELRSRSARARVRTRKRVSEFERNLRGAFA